MLDRQKDRCDSYPSGNYSSYLQRVECWNKTGIWQSLTEWQSTRKSTYQIKNTVQMLAMSILLGRWGLQASGPATAFFLHLPGRRARCYFRWTPHPQTQTRGKRALEGGPVNTETGQRARRHSVTGDSNNWLHSRPTSSLNTSLSSCWFLITASVYQFDCSSHSLPQLHTFTDVSLTIS